MPWRPGRQGTICRICDRNITECGPLSARGRCYECRHRRLAENIEGIATHSGPAFRRWRRAMAASVGGVLLDEIEPGE